jgi:hypothetical protein
MEHAFTPTIHAILARHFGDLAGQVYRHSELIQYLNAKTASASRGSKSRGAFANHYAIYVLVEDYLHKGFAEQGGYADYEGAVFSDLFRRQRELPFGAKLQNHALNSRLNEEFRKFFPDCEYMPVVHDVQSSRYWFNESLLRLSVAGNDCNIARAVIDIIDAYVEAKRYAFKRFVEDCARIRALQSTDPSHLRSFVHDLLKPEVDARVFEIVSYAVLKEYYTGQAIFWGFTEDDVSEDRLVLYKTGRTNANDGGIDFVMRPLGRFFQVTETTDVRKYFLDIDKVEHYPITFVVKSTDPVDAIAAKMRAQAAAVYGVSAVVEKYMECVEEIINIPRLEGALDEIAAQGRLPSVLEEIALQSSVEFHYATSD